MSEVLSRLIRALDYAPLATVRHDDLPKFPDGELDRLLAAGLFIPAPPTQRLRCDECGDLHEVLLLRRDNSPEVGALLLCGHFGAHRIPIERLSRWEMSISRFVDVITGQLQPVGDRAELVPSRVWRLGKVRWNDASRHVVFARGLHRNDARQILASCALPNRSVILVPSKFPVQKEVQELASAVFPLDTLLAWHQGKLQFNHREVESLLAMDPPPAATETARQPVPKRATRTALIESLQRELEEHLRTARDYAVDTLERTGVPRLLPRPTKEFLAKRLGVNKSTVSRCFEDASAGQLRLLWEVAADVDQLLSAAGCGA
jgi:hypothetical protein